jgi:hypothetical protein
MRTVLLLALVGGTSLGSADPLAREERPSAFAAIARVVTAREAGQTVSAGFDARTCALHNRVSGGETELDIPLRKVSWSMTTDKRGVESVIVVTARCAAKDRKCIAGTTATRSLVNDPPSRENVAEPRFAFRFAAPPVEARKRFGELKKLDAHCAPPATKR